MYRNYSNTEDEEKLLKTFSRWRSLLCRQSFQSIILIVLVFLLWFLCLSLNRNGDLCNVRGHKIICGDRGKVSNEFGCACFVKFFKSLILTFSCLKGKYIQHEVFSEMLETVFFSKHHNEINKLHTYVNFS